MLAPRNRRFRIAALFLSAAYLVETVGGLINANRIFGQALPGGYEVGTAIAPAAQLVGLAGWLVVAVAFGAEIDWRRLRAGGTIVASTYIAVAAASLLRYISYDRHLHEIHGRLGYVAGVVATILGAVRFKPERTPMAVGLYITAAYWFTASTSFANPAVTVARSLSDTFAGIAPSSAPAFILAQIVGALLAAGVMGWLLKTETPA